MTRLVIVSNRLADLRKATAGGLAVALGDTLELRGGLWFGWSGHVTEGGAPGEGELHLQRNGRVTLAGLDLCPEDLDAYYRRYANGVLWPVFHYRVDLARFDTASLAGYRRVNRLFARKLMPMIEPDDIIWIHDYHLIPLADELRAVGCTNRIGYFLHIPLPPPQILVTIPGHEWLMRALFAYDLVGFQTHTDLQHFQRYALDEGGATRLADGRYAAFGRTLTADAFPIGIDVRSFERMGHSREALETYEHTRRDYDDRRIVVGVDRLDYSKGLPQRVRAFRELLARYPENRGETTFIQIASPSREDVEAYADIQRELENLCGAINGDLGDLHWVPVRYIHRTIARKRLPGLYRASRVGLVTPLRDGMNLVAKEYVVSQDPADPGVLVLSRFAGASEQMREALLVNPYDVDALAQAIQQALHMSLDERRARHAALLENVRKYDVHWWCRTFLDRLNHVPRDAHEDAARH